MRLVIFLFSAMVMNVANAQKVAQHIEKGNENYKLKQFSQAKNEYNKALEKDNTNAVARFNSGNASQQMKQYDNASKAYDSAAASTKDPIVRSQAFYNQGVSFIRQKKLAEAIDAFKKSLRLNPNDSDTRENLQKALKELKQQQQPKENKQNKDQNTPKEKDQPQQPKTKLSKEEADKLLNNLQKEEKNLQKQVQKKNQSARQLKDW